MNPTAIENFLELSPQNARLLEQQARQFLFEQPGPVIHKGQAVSGAYMVLEGELRVFTYSAVGNEATLYRLRPGETCVLTLNCLFNNLRYPAWVEATARSRVAFIPGELYRRFFAEEPSVRDTTVKALSTLVFRLMDELEEVHSCTLEQRLARFLLNNADNEGVVKMTQQKLASHLGTSREVVARLMQGLTAREVVMNGRGRVMVKDAAALASLIEPGPA